MTETAQVAAGNGAEAGGVTPDQSGHFGRYGGRFAPEALMAALDELTTEYLAAKDDPRFQADLGQLLRGYAGRPTLITEAPRFAAAAVRAGESGAGPAARVLLKREDLAHTGSHKINNVLGQALLTRRMGKTRVIAETGAGQHHYHQHHHQQQHHHYQHHHHRYCFTTSTIH
jgi:tryptophan synthase beta chain